MNQPKPWKTATDFDDERQRSYLQTALLVWLILLLFFILRDPVWRLLYEGEPSPFHGATDAGWTELDADLIEALTSVPTPAREGVAGLETALLEAINRRRLEHTPEGQVPLAASVPVDNLVNVARTRAAAWGATTPGEEPNSPELIYPEVYFALLDPTRLTRSFEIHQELAPGARLDLPQLADELLDGWLNRTRFRSAILEGQDLEIGVGVVRDENQVATVDAVALETIAKFSVAVPTLASVRNPLMLRGAGDPDRLKLFLKGPSDATFSPLPLTWNGNLFEVEIPWSQGPGNYALRAGLDDRLSDPKPIYVK